ncbi:hypothetical protein NUACC21_01380 [Scytonema sp. NUACC21]
MFSGQGGQYVNMGRELYSVEPTFRQHVDTCAEILQPHLGVDIRSVLYPTSQDTEKACFQLQQTVFAQPALFVVEYALAQLWMEWGVHPQATIGHSIGEYVAATIAGVFSLEDALAVVATRGKLMQQLPTGSMLAIGLPYKDVQLLLDAEPLDGKSLDIAAINSPSSCVVSGTNEAISALQEQLFDQGIECRLLHTSHAFHSHMMSPILEPFVQLVKTVKLRPPRIRFISNVTGTWMSDEQATNPNYWSQHLRQTVKFSDGITQLLEQFEGVFLEVGPGRTLSTLTIQHLQRNPQQVVLSSLPHVKEQQSDVAWLLQTLGRLWLSGVQIDWSGFYRHERRHRLPLPTYPFERQRYWIEPPKPGVDRKALPDPDRQSQVSQDFVAPRTPIEEMLASIWASLLQLDRVGIHDNFFTLGGHSLLATQLMSRVQSTFAVELPLRSLFELPTVAALAESIATAQQSQQSQQTPPIVRVPRQLKMPVSFAQQRLWFLQQFEPESGFYNIPVAVRFQGQPNIIALEHSLNHIISRHEALRTNFIQVDGQPMQVIASSTPLSLTVVDLQQLDTTEGEITCQQLIAVEAVRPFDLATDLLVRASLFQLQPTEHVLLLVMHHIVSDAWSMGVLVRELATVYQAICNELPIALPELPIQYADFAVWQQQWLQGEVLAKQMEYWQQQLAGAPSLLELPTERSRPAIQTYTGATKRFLLSPQLSEKLVVLSQKQEVTLFMTLLAAFQTLLYRYTGQTDICVGTPIANRNRKETEELIGVFVNTLVLRSNLSGNPSFGDLLSRVREVALGAYAHQDLPFEQLVEQLQPERSLSYTPQVWLYFYTLV